MLTWNFLFGFRACMLGWRCCHHRTAYHCLTRSICMSLIPADPVTQQMQSELWQAISQKSPDKPFKHLYFFFIKTTCRLFFLLTQKNQSAPGNYTYSWSKVTDPQTYVSMQGRGEISGAQDEHSDKGKYRRGDLTVCLDWLVRSRSCSTGR